MFLLRVIFRSGGRCLFYIQQVRVPSVDLSVVILRCLFPAVYVYIWQGTIFCVEDGLRCYDVFMDKNIVVDEKKLVNLDGAVDIARSTDLVRTSDVLGQITKTVKTKDVASLVLGFDIVRLHYNRICFWGGIVGTGLAATAASVITAISLSPESFTNSKIGLGETLIVISPILATLAGSIFGLPVLASKMVSSIDVKRLNKAMKSSDPVKRGYYVNRMLYTLITEKPRTTLFDDSHSLAYALWLYENVHQLLPASWNRRKVRKFFKEVSFADFANDINFDVYIDVAGGMNSGDLDKAVIPFSDATSGKRKILRKAKAIVNSREYGRVAYIERFEEDAQIAIEMLGNGDFTKQGGVSKTVQNSYLDDVQALKDIEAEWLDTQSDIIKILKFPMFSDIREPLVQSFYTKLSVAKSLMGRVSVNDFVVAISDLKVAWGLLMHEARRVELSKFNDGERKKIIMATNLMNIALSTASTPAERQSAYKKAMEQLNGLVVLPEITLAVLEESVSRKEILELHN